MCYSAVTGGDKGGHVARVRRWVRVEARKVKQWGWS